MFFLFFLRSLIVEFDEESFDVLELSDSELSFFFKNFSGFYRLNSSIFILYSAYIFADSYLYLFFSSSGKAFHFFPAILDNSLALISTTNYKHSI